MNKIKLFIYLNIILVGYICGDYLALILRTGEYYGGIKYPFSLCLIITLIAIFLNRIKSKIDLEIILGLILIGWYLGTILHFNNLINFPTDRNLLIMWISVLPYLIILNLKFISPDIDKILKSLIILSVISIISYYYIRTWEVDGETYFQFMKSTLMLMIPINLILIGLIYRVNNINAMKLAIIEIYYQGIENSYIYLGILMGIWINSFRWEKYEIGDNSQNFVIFLISLCFTGLAIELLKFISKGKIVVKAKNN